MINQETIIALATPTGLGAISVIRISGLNAISITEKLFKSKGNKKLSNQNSHTVHLGHLIKNNHELDEVLVTIFKSIIIIYKVFFTNTSECVMRFIHVIF